MGEEGKEACIAWVYMLLIKTKKQIGMFLTRDSIAELLSGRILWLMLLKTIYFFVWKHDFFSQQHACDTNEKYTVCDGQGRLSSWTSHTDCAVTALSVNASKGAITLMEQN